MRFFFFLDNFEIVLLLRVLLQHALFPLLLQRLQVDHVLAAVVSKIDFNELNILLTLILQGRLQRLIEDRLEVRGLAMIA